MSANKSTGFFRGWFASGEPWIWMNAAAVGVSVSAVVGIVLLIAVKGLAHFWPADVAKISFEDKNGQQQLVFGELIELDDLPVKQFLESGGNPLYRRSKDATLVGKTGNRKPTHLTFAGFTLITQYQTPEGVIVLERVEWGNAL